MSPYACAWSISFLVPGKTSVADQPGRQHQTLLAAEIVADQHRHQAPLGRLVEDLVGLKIKLGDAIDNRGEHLRFLDHLHQRGLHAEGGTRVLEMARPRQRHRDGVLGNRIDDLATFRGIDVFLRIGPIKVVDAGGILIILEESRRRQSPFLVAAGALLMFGELEGRSDMVAGRGLVGDIDVVDVVVDFPLEVVERGSTPKCFSKAGIAALTGSPIQVAGRSTGFALDGPDKAFSMVHGRLLSLLLKTVEDDGA